MHFLLGRGALQALRSNIRELVDSIDVEEAKAEQLRKRIAASTGDTLDRQEELLKQLNKEVLPLSFGVVLDGDDCLFPCRANFSEGL